MLALSLTLMLVLAAFCRRQDMTQFDDDERGADTADGPLVQVSSSNWRQPVDPSPVALFSPALCLTEEPRPIDKGDDMTEPRSRRDLFASYFEEALANARSSVDE